MNNYSLDWNILCSKNKVLRKERDNLVNAINSIYNSFNTKNIDTFKTEGMYLFGEATIKVLEYKLDLVRKEIKSNRDLMRKVK